MRIMPLIYFTRVAACSPVSLYHSTAVYTLSLTGTAAVAVVVATVFGWKDTMPVAAAPVVHDSVKGVHAVHLMHDHSSNGSSSSSSSCGRRDHHWHAVSPIYIVSIVVEKPILRR
jgi:hypothetical protein